MHLDPLQYARSVTHCGSTLCCCLLAMAFTLSGVSAAAEVSSGMVGASSGDAADAPEYTDYLDGTALCNFQEPGTPARGSGRRVTRRQNCCPVPGADGWFSADYLHTWLQGDRVPALVTSSPLGTDRDDAGVLGLPSTTTLFGDERIGESQPGVRLSLGRFLDNGCEYAFASEFFWLGQDAELFSAVSDGNPALARPFFNTDPNVNAEDAELVAFDDPIDGDILDGRVSVDADNNIYSTSLYFSKALACRGGRYSGYRCETLAGYRYFQLEERLSITENLLVTGGGAVAVGTTFDITDRFATSNEFHGFECGLKTQCYRGPWTFDALAKLGLGNDHQRIRIDGSTTITVPTFTPFTTSGGLLVQDTNAGVYEFDEFALLPELRLQLGRRLNENCHLRVGYNLLFLTEALRPGPSIDRMVDGRFLDPLAPPFVATNPQFSQESSSVWLQGINLGFVSYF